MSIDVCIEVLSLITEKLRNDLYINQILVMVPDFEALLFMLKMQDDSKYCSSSSTKILKKQVQRFYFLGSFESSMSVKGALPEAS